MYYFDYTFILLIPAIILSLYASFKVNSTTKKYFRERTSSDCSGMEVARYILDANNLNNVSIEVVNGTLSDHYDPRKKVVRLSKDVYYGNSITAISVASHECGHAIQHATSYLPLVLRHSFVPVVNFCSNISGLLFFIGFILSIGPLVNIGILFFSSSVIFHLVTLPVEFNASRRALKQLKTYNLLEEKELKKGKKVLSAAALTYVSAMLMSFMQLIRLILISSSRND
ncbi:MAG: zinc metallopeptidase [Romboutsia sp.]|nr:zinc metallopeptidase [Romboutsia sp.]